MKLKRFFLFSILSFATTLSWNCKGEDVDFKDKSIFLDGLLAGSGINLFTLFDDFPALKSGLSRLNANDFNFKLNQSLESIRPSLPESLFALGFLFKEEQNAIRNLFFFLSQEMSRLRINNANLFDSMVPGIEKIRNASGSFLTNILPITNQGLNHLLNTKSEETISSQIEYLNSILEDPETKEFLEKTELIFEKMFVKNQTLRSGITNLLSGFFKSKDSTLVNSFTETLGGLGDGFSKKSGVGSGFKSAGTSLKELFVNIENHFTVTGTNFTADYNETGHSARIQPSVRDFLIQLRQLILPPAQFIQNSSITPLSQFTQSFSELNFTSNLNNANYSFNQMLELDLNGKNRTLDASSESISLLEHLLLTVGIANDFGYFWNNDPTEPQITSMSGGILTIGDSLFSMSSKLSSLGVVVRQGSLNFGSNSISLQNNDSAIQIGDTVRAVGIPDGTTVIGTNSNSVTISNSITSTTPLTPITFKRSTSISNLGVSAVIWNSAISGKVRKNGVIQSISLNTPALSLLQKDSLLTNPNDPIYTKTLPWILGQLSRVLYSGEGPYYNKNRKNESGNIQSFDGRVYRTSDGIDQVYRKTWTTDHYRIFVKNSSNNQILQAGLGGTSFLENDTGLGSAYTIREIEISEDSRAVESDEEEFYKNYQWLLYQKRFVLVIPVALEALGDTIQDSVYIVIVANGLKGLTSVKPYCSNVSCSENDSGRWRYGNFKIKNNFKASGDLENFSNQPGDSAFLIEAWGYGISADSNTNFGFVDETTFQQIYRLLFSKFSSPNQFYGPIPPSISAQIPCLERLGFLSVTEVLSESIKRENSVWNLRNHFLPYIASLANSFVRTSSSSNNRNSFLLLANLIQILNRPYVTDAIDRTASSDTNDSAFPNKNIVIRQYKIRGYSGVFGMRSPSMPVLSLYYPQTTLRSHLSFLIENSRRWNDGILNSLSKGNFFKGLSNFLFQLGAKENEEARSQMILGLQQFISEFRNIDEFPNSNQFAADAIGSEVELFFQDWILTRGKNVNSSSYAILDDIETIFANLLNPSSPYTYLNNLREILAVTKEANLTTADISSFLFFSGKVFQKENESSKSTFSAILTEQVPKLLRQTKGRTKAIVRLLESLSKDGLFLNYFFREVRSSYSTADIWKDWERFLKAPMVQLPTRDKNDLFYNIGEISFLFANLIQSPTRPMQTEYWFVDVQNRRDETTLFDRFNFLFSKK